MYRHLPRVFSKLVSATLRSSGQTQSRRATTAALDLLYSASFVLLHHLTEGMEK